MTRFLVKELAKVRRTTKFAIVTKTDLAAPDRIAQHLLDVAELGRATGVEWAEVVPVSAVAGDQVGAARPTCWCGRCPRGRSSTPTTSCPTSPRSTWPPS